MKRLQLIFCVETNKQSNTDFRYIMSVIDRFYDYKNGHILINPVNMRGKGSYITGKINRQITSLISQFKAGSDHGESYVFLCVDCDQYDSDPSDRKFLIQAEEYCLNRPNYRLIWFCRDVEDVFLGHRISDKQKTVEVNRFVRNKMIDLINVQNLSVSQYKPNSSNILLVLNQFLPMKKDKAATPKLIQT